MRWKWIVPRLLIAFSIWAFIHWGMDPLLRWTAVSALQSVTGARVDIRRVVTTFFPPSIDIQQTAVASARRRGRNLFEFDRMSLQLENRSLSQRRFVISDGRIENLQFDTWRSDDGQLEKPATPVVEEPSWASEKLKELGDEWLTQLSEQARAQLDPNTLETWRLGSEVYEKWDVRFEDLTDRARDLEPRVRSLSEQFKLAKEGSTVDQIEKYLEVAREADLVLQDARRLQNDLKQMAPEVRTDFESINQARLNDQQMIQQKIALLKPDGRRISQALLGRDVYLRVQEMLTWFELFRSYQSELTQQVQPPRNPGRTWPVLPVSPGPAFHARKLSLSGNMSIDRDLVPWQAVLSDITSDPRLLGKPAVLEASAAGPRPLQLKYTVDATTDVLRSELTAELRDPQGFALAAGRRQKARFEAGLSNLTWTAEVALTGNDMSGFIQLVSDIDGLSFEASDDVRPEILEAANEALHDIQSLDVVLALTGTLQKPDIVLSTELGDQIASGIQTAVMHQLDRARARLLEEADRQATAQLARLRTRFGEEYNRLAKENEQLITQVQEVTQLLAALRSGKVDPRAVIQQVSNSKLLKERDRESVQRVVNGVNGVMQGQLPQELLQKLPIPRSTDSETATLMIPGMLPGSLPGLLPGLMQGIQQATAEAEQKTAPARSIINSVMQPPAKAATAEKARTIINSRLPGLLPALTTKPAPAADSAARSEISAPESADSDQNQLPLIIPGFKPRR
ncbi:MAG: TIGR03545 family protein [Planctomyces sp.]|nr:TIGR03545 family protein [Planctomyces sp.]